MFDCPASPAQHTKAIIHRDIKPENILFSRNMVRSAGGRARSCHGGALAL
jgi:serine/threonine protein kinase